MTYRIEEKKWILYRHTNSIRVLWSRVKNKDNGMAYNGHTVYRCADNIPMENI